MAVRQKASTEKIIGAIPMDEVKEALVNEYRRRIIRYKMVDEAMKRKYGMTFIDFESRNIVKEREFSWQVESDAMEWEHAVAGIGYAERKLRAIEQA